MSRIVPIAVMGIVLRRMNAFATMDMLVLPIKTRVSLCVRCAISDNVFRLESAFATKVILTHPRKRDVNQFAIRLAWTVNVGILAIVFVTMDLH